jgi:hypothetical protein
MSAQLALDLHARPEPGVRYFVTTRLTADELNQAIERATNQDDVVLAMFRRFGAMTPSRCWTHYRAATGKHATPLTSIRRSISVLTKARVLVKTDEQKLGPMNMPERVWRLCA